MNYDINEQETSIDNMGDTLLDAMKQCVKTKRAEDAASIYNEWVVDGRDPCDGEFEFIFIPNHTLS
tara:strand:- start:1672 stop:1869 length:198 start_codon:yes stop_codon:yes gene_type:complete